MPCCSGTSITPGTGNISSGYTSQLQSKAVQCDQERLLARLRSVDCCTAPPQTPKGAVYSSILEQNAMTRCQPVPTTQSFLFPRVGVPESVRIQRVQDHAFLCSSITPVTRFIPPVPCPPVTGQGNPVNPKPTNQPGCTPSRFF